MGGTIFRLNYLDIWIIFCTFVCKTKTNKYDNTNKKDCGVGR